MGASYEILKVLIRLPFDQTCSDLFNQAETRMISSFLVFCWHWMNVDLILKAVDLNSTPSLAPQWNILKNLKSEVGIRCKEICVKLAKLKLTDWTEGCEGCYEKTNGGVFWKKLLRIFFEGVSKGSGLFFRCLFFAEKAQTPTRVYHFLQGLLF